MRWTVLAVALAAATAIGIGTSQVFEAGLQPIGMPIIQFSVFLSLAGLFVLCIFPLVARSTPLAEPAARRLLLAVFLLGLALRLALLASVPILEVDFNRYLWDGAMTARGFNPYAVAPADIAALPYADPRLDLSKQAVGVFERISYPELKTIYPPLAQAAFALAHRLAPWSLTAWRLLCIAADTATFSLLVALLAATGRSPLWAALYWWNPLVLKEIANSAHMEAVLLPLVLGSLLLAARGRDLGAVVLLALATATKLWPVMLAPLVLRPLVGRPARFAAACGLFGGIVGAAAVPVWLGGLDQSSGFVGFATHWSTNSALFPALQALTATVTGLEAGAVSAGRLVRVVCALAVLALAVSLARRPHRHASDLTANAYAVVSALVLLSPAQFPWYVLWVLPLAVLHGGIGWLVATATLPLYYTAFHFRARGDFTTFDTSIVWLIWVPVWLALAWDAVRARPRSPAETRSGPHS